MQTKYLFDDECVISSFQFQEILELQTGTTCLQLTLKGRGVSPLVSVSVEGDCLDMGTVLAEDFKDETFKVGRITFGCAYEALATVLHAEIPNRFLFTDCEHIDPVGAILHQTGQQLPVSLQRHARTSGLCEKRLFSPVMCR